MPKDLLLDVGQVLWVGIDGPVLTADEERWLSSGKAGVVVLFGRNLVEESPGRCDLAALIALNQSIHNIDNGDRPLFVAVDQEGGRVQRVRSPLTRWPPMLCHENLDLETALRVAKAVGRRMGRELALLHFDIDFAPVLDVHTNDANPIIGDRAFSRDPERASRCALAFAGGLADAGILACGKHFPGHGDTEIDSHLALPRLAHDMERLRAVELVPFKAAARHRVPMIMTAHIVFTALESNVPATLSSGVLDLLRNELGYEGVIVSDDLDMQAIAAEGDVSDAAVDAISAGCDALLLCRDKSHQAQTFDALVEGCERDSRFRARVGDAARRVRGMKGAHLARRSSFGTASASLAALASLGEPEEVSELLAAAQDE